MIDHKEIVHKVREIFVKERLINGDNGPPIDKSLFETTLECLLADRYVPQCKIYDKWYQRCLKVGTSPVPPYTYRNLPLRRRLEHRQIMVVTSGFIR